jgi:hypothetical protein
MQTKYIIGLVVTAVIITLGVLFLIYKNWDDIVKVFNKPKNVVEDNFDKAVPGPVTKTSPDEILDKVPEDPVLTQELAELNEADLASQKSAAETEQKSQQIVKKEAAIKKSQSEPVSSTIILATKYKKIGDEKGASAKYDEVLKNIETEKAKSTVLLSGIYAEKMKAEKLAIMDSLDMEYEYLDNLIIGSPVHVINKRDAEIFVKNHMESV